jgi:hypothetical protein
LTSQQLLETRLRRLAKDIEGLAGKDEMRLRHSREIAELRRRAAAELFAVCETFVDSVNRLLPAPEVELDPRDFSADHFHEERANLLQINVRGRILQVEFEATPDLVSTEDFRVPYTLSGAVRAFNQALLDKDLIEEQLIFYTLEKQKTMWRFFDARTYRSGELDQEYLVGLMEELL